jgi:hypothetical protein
LHFLGTSYAPAGRGIATIAPLATRWGLADLVEERTERLPLSLTLHADRYRDEGEAATRATIDGYDHWRHQRQPYARQRRVRDLGVAAFYGWSEDKARQYSVPERADFGAYVRGRGFRLD